MTLDKRRALLAYGAAVLSILIGLAIAGSRFPGGYDWAYTVISKLASTNQNPEGGRWLAGGLLVAVVLLWPVATYLERTASLAGSRPRFAGYALRLGLIGGALLGLEGVLTLELSRRVEKAHEALALVTFLGFYGGVLGFYVHRIRDTLSFLVPALLVILPLVAVGLTQLILYLDQRDLGWVSTDWREIGVPIWLSFAFWQWMAVAFLGIGIGVLIAVDPVGPRDGPRSAPPDPGRKEHELSAEGERRSAFFAAESPDHIDEAKASRPAEDRPRFRVKSLRSEARRGRA